MKITEMTLEQCFHYKALIEARIKELELSESPKVLFNPSEHFERYNGGWTKTVDGLNKAKTDGYSIIGEFTENRKKDFYTVGKLYLDCGIGGSRNNQKKYYSLFKIDKEGNPIVIEKASGNNWATDLWEAIEKNI